MNVRSKKFILLILLVFLSFPSVSCFGWTIHEGVKFHTDSGTITFANAITVSHVKFENQKVEFTSLQMDGIVLPSWWISCTGGTVTVSRLFRDKKLVLSVSGSSGESYTVSFYHAGLGKPSVVYRDGEEIAEGKGWSMQGDDIVLTGTFASSHVWEILWTESSEESAGGGGGGVTPGGEGGMEYHPLKPIVTPYVDLKTWGVVAVAAVIGFVVLLSQYQESKRTWKTRRVKAGRWKPRREAKVKWKRKKKVFD